MAWVASSRQTHDKASDDFPLKTDSINLKKIGIDIDPSRLADLKDVLWLTEQFAVSISS